MFRKKYARLVGNMLNVQKQLTESQDPYLQRRFAEAREALASLHAKSVDDYARRYGRKNVAKLREIIRQNRLDLTVPSILNEVQIARLHAAEMRLHPAFSAVVLVDRGVYAAKAIRIAKSKGYRTILIGEVSEETSYAAQLADHVLSVSDINNIDEVMQVSSHFRDHVLGLPKYRLGFDPGFGVLSEVPAFAAACEKNDFVFLGPAAEPMSIMCDKTQVKAMAERSGIPVIPGYAGDKQDRATLLAKAKEIGFPIMLKKAHGGGGTGMRQVENEAQFDEALSDLRSSDANAVVFIEKFLRVTRHFEVQTFFGVDAAIELSTRKCDLQRRRQKFMEMAPGFDDPSVLALVKSHGRAFMNEMKKTGYQGAATIEFLVVYDEKAQKHVAFLLEVNPRFQVEHGPTEEINQLDFVGLKFWGASGRSVKSFIRRTMYDNNLIVTPNMTLDAMLDELRNQSPNKFAVQARIENVYFETGLDGTVYKASSLGTIEHVEMDSSIERGIVNGTKLDDGGKNPLIAMPVGVGPDYVSALKDLLRLLESMHIEGVETNIQRQISNVRFLLANPDLITDSTTVHAMDLNFIQGKTPKSHPFKLFDTSKALETGKHRLPVKRYEPRPGRSGHTHD